MTKQETINYGDIYLNYIPNNKILCLLSIQDNMILFPQMGRRITYDLSFLDNKKIQNHITVVEQYKANYPFQGNQFVFRNFLNWILSCLVNKDMFISAGKITTDYYNYKLKVMSANDIAIFNMQRNAFFFEEDVYDLPRDIDKVLGIIASKYCLYLGMSSQIQDISNLLSQYSLIIADKNVTMQAEIKYEDSYKKLESFFKEMNLGMFMTCLLSNLLYLKYFCGTVKSLK
jgi:hypothetical protein